MKVIYTPAGKAREYSPKALNIYMSCSHHCEYCYAPNCIHTDRESYYRNPEPRKDIARMLEMDIRENGAPKEQVLLSFIGDVYCETADHNKATRDCLEILAKHQVPTAILTKGGDRCLRDLDLFKKFRAIQIGTTLTFDNDQDSLKWESGAATPDERIRMLLQLHNEGIRTFASFEPVIDPEQSLNLMAATLSIVDVYKVGKLNNYKGLDKKIDWTDFLRRALEILRPSGKEIYIKYDLRENAKEIRLTPEEMDPDIHNVK